ncbi:MAG: aconitate hydratase AcnA, partial [Proteobacteria bacterium]|nr:aconitate hydratase AcnA [Pseudomonadota bacterium]
YGSRNALDLNTKLEFQRNKERYQFMKWGMQAFDTFKVVPPGIGIVHQVNLEYLARGMHARDDTYYPDTLVGTDSHTTMINGIGVVGWGVGGIEAEAGMLGQPVYFLTPDVVGVHLKGQLRWGVTATDLVLTVTEMLRTAKVVGKFVEFFGPGLDALALADRATLANMAPEYGATCGLFPVDGETLRYLSLSGHGPERIALVEAYAKAQGLWRGAETPEPAFTDVLAFDLGQVEPSVAGPRRPQDRVALSRAPASFAEALALLARGGEGRRRAAVPGRGFELADGAVAIAAITSCTNTSNPSVMLAAGLLARKARERGLRVKPWVRASLAPGSRVVSDYLARAGLQADLDALGFHLVGYGCTTCMGNSGPLDKAVARAIESEGLVVVAVLSGNRNFEGRIHPLVRAAYLASPPLVVAYALAGSLEADLTSDPLGEDRRGNPVYLRDLWPSGEEVRRALAASLDAETFRRRYASVFEGDARWRSLAAGGAGTFAWEEASTYIQEPPFLAGVGRGAEAPADIRGARVLALLGDSITTDHVSPGGAIRADTPAGRWLLERGVAAGDFNSYIARRANHEVMIRGTFANIRLRNEMTPGREGGFTRHHPSGEATTIFEAAMRYRDEGVPLVVVAGREYGTGSSRDWAAKGTRLLGVRAVIAESFERIHRANLVFMGVLPLEFPAGVTRKTLGLDGSERIDVAGIAGGIAPGAGLPCRIVRAGGGVEEIGLRARIDTADEAEYFRHGGILPFVLREVLNSAA